MTIEEFVSSMNWNNEKYYSQMVNGYRDKNGQLKYKNPTVKFLFSGISHAMKNDLKWQNNKVKIIQLIDVYFLNWK